MTREGKPLEGFCLAYADLSGVNLVRFGTHEPTNMADADLYQAKEHNASGDKLNSLRLFKEAEEIYRHLQAACESMGLYDNVGGFLQRAMTVRRFQYPLISVRRMISKLVDLSCGYGENPVRVILFSLFIIFSFGFFSFFSV